MKQTHPLSVTREVVVIAIFILLPRVQWLKDTGNKDTGVNVQK